MEMLENAPITVEFLPGSTVANMPPRRSIRHFTGSMK
jgi:hypothetical protein